MATGWDSQGRHPASPTEPYGWWGYGWHAPEPRSIVALIEGGTLDARAAATVWLMLEARASVVVAAQAPGAGKTTMLTALLDFLPPGVRRLYLRGWSETFAFLGEADPARSYLLCNEISAHLPVYLWGRKVGQLFAAVEEGYGLGTTMHADSLAELAATLEGYPLYVPRRAVARLDLLLTLDVDYDPHERRAHRHLAALQLLRRTGEGDDFDLVMLARWDPARGGIVHRDGEPPPGLLRHTGLGPDEFANERERRAAFLGDLAARGVRPVAEVRQELAAYTGVAARPGDQGRRAETAP
jgi:hypothetical protein